MRDSIEDAVRAIITGIGEDKDREGLLDTPKRVSKAYMELTEGYRQDPKEILSKQFNVESPCLVKMDGIEFYSLCEHHMLPFYGTVNIEYMPRDKVVGLSKLPRLVRCFSKRLQIQEKLTQEIANAIHENIQCRYVKVTITAVHLCVMMRGVSCQNATTTTEYMIGKNG